LNGISIDSNYSGSNIGTEADPGLNEIFDNGNYNVYSETTDEIKAELNWWGQAPPDPAFFSGNIDYTPWLTEPPRPGPYPSISSISPNVGATAGGTRVTITGDNFVDGATVTFDVNPATNVEFISETELKATTPASGAKIATTATGFPGIVDVTVTNPGGKSATLVDGFLYVDIPCAIPGDVSGNGMVTAYDAALILQRVVGLISEFDCESSGGLSPIASNPRAYRVSVPDMSVASGNRIQVPIAVDDATGLVAGAIALKYDASVLKAVRVFPTKLLSRHYWDYQIGDAMTYLAFAGEKAASGKGALFYVEFDALPATNGASTPLFLETVQLSANVGIAKINGSITVLPAMTALLQNYPNPFNPETWVPYLLAEPAEVVINIYDVHGQLVRTVNTNGVQPAGSYTTKGQAAYWDGRDESGERVASGLYFYTLTAGNFRATRKLIVVK